MSIPRDVRAERRSLLCSVFEHLKELYRTQRRGRKNITWSGGQSGALEHLDCHWEHCVQKVYGVYDWLTQGVDGEIEWHKIIAMTQCNILKELPLTFDDKKTSKGEEYKLNAVYAFSFGLGTMKSWLTRWYEARLLEFDADFFIRPFSNTKEWADFQQKQHELCVSMLHDKPSFSLLFVTSKLWSDIGQWGLTTMRQSKKTILKIEK